MKKSFGLPTTVLRETELERISTLLKKDSDLVITGVPGIGRRTLIRNAANQAGVRHLEVDCLRCRSAGQFVRLLADSINNAFCEPDEFAKIRQWSSDQASLAELFLLEQVRLVEAVATGKEWTLFERLLLLPQYLAESLTCRIVIVFHNFAHIRAWDRHRKWETRLLQEIQQQSQVSYVLVAIVSEPWMEAMGLPVIFLGPLSDLDMQNWATLTVAATGLSFDPDDQSLAVFLSYVQGHIKDAITLAQRIQLACYADSSQVSAQTIHVHHVRSSMLALVKDIEVTFEALLLLLPPTQAKLLESLSIDPTARPQSNAYIKKHYLSRGGSLQGALSSLEQKGLIYGPQFGYCVSLPLLDFWIRCNQRL